MRLLRTPAGRRKQRPRLFFQPTRQRRLRNQHQEPGGGTPDVHAPIRESLGEERLVRRIEARLDCGEDASSFLGRDLRPVVRQELSGAGQVQLAKPANERCPRCAAGGRRPGFLPVLPDPPPDITGHVRKAASEPCGTGSAQVDKGGVRVVGSCGRAP